MRCSRNAHRQNLVAASATSLVLGILAEGEAYGYAILRRVRELSQGRMPWTDGLLYSLLHRLERLSYASASWGTSDEGRTKASRDHEGRLGHPRRAPPAVGRGRQCARPRVARRTSRPRAVGGLIVIEDDSELASLIAQWRGYVGRRQTIADPDLAEVIRHLGEQLTHLTATGLHGWGTSTRTPASSRADTRSGSRSSSSSCQPSPTRATSRPRAIWSVVLVLLLPPIFDFVWPSLYDHIHDPRAGGRNATCRRRLLATTISSPHN